MRGMQKSLEVRKHLASVYVTRGYDAAKPIALKHGYQPRYICQMAKALLGHYRTIYYSRNPFVQDAAYRFDPRFETPVRISEAA